MTGIAHGAAEEFYALRLANAGVLERAARARVAAGDAVGAVALSWAADVEVFQAVVWERVVVVAGATPRHFFEAAERAVAVSGEWSADAEGLVRASRAALVARLDTSLAREIAQRWPDSAYLAALEAPSADEFTLAAARRLEGQTPDDFVQRRRVQGMAQMQQALEQRVRGNTREAIRLAYSGDCLFLEAYLVQSALAAGDPALMTVTSRWELSTQSVASLASLPGDFTSAVSAIRAALAMPLGDMDGQRLLESLPPV